MPIINRSQFPPGGWKYTQPETGWKIENPGFTFEETAIEIFKHRAANPTIFSANGLDTCRNDLDAYTEARATKEGWFSTSLFSPAQSVLPKSTALPDTQAQPVEPQSQRQVGVVARFAEVVKGDLEGAKIVALWLGNGMNPVTRRLAQNRANVCLNCPSNELGKRKITGGLAKALKWAAELKSHADLHVKGEEGLGTCKNCGCHLPTKVWVQSRHIAVGEAPKEPFPDYCWVKNELDRRLMPPVLANQKELEPFAWTQTAVKEPGPIHQQNKWQGGIFTIPKDSRDLLFNSGLVQRSDGLWLAARRHSSPRSNTVVMFKLDDMMNIESGKEVTFKKVNDNEHFEDPRVITIPGTDNVLLTACNYFLHSLQSGSHAHQGIFLLDKDWVCQASFHPAYGANGISIEHNTGNEKNWCLFYHGQTPHFVYSCSSKQKHQVVQLNPSTFQPEQAFVTEGIVWPYGEARGGTPPVRIGDEYWSFFHSSQPWQTTKRRYFMGAYAFSAKAPFELTRYTKIPIAAGSQLDPMVPNWSPLVVFPCGAVFDGDDWLITYGINDTACGWNRIPHEELVAAMAEA